MCGKSKSRTTTFWFATPRYTVLPLKECEAQNSLSSEASRSWSATSPSATAPAGSLRYPTCCSMYFPPLCETCTAFMAPWSMSRPTAGALENGKLPMSRPTARALKNLKPLCPLCQPPVKAPNLLPQEQRQYARYGQKHPERQRAAPLDPPRGYQESTGEGAHKRPQEDRERRVRSQES